MKKLTNTLILALTDNELIELSLALDDRLELMHNDCSALGLPIDRSISKKHLTRLSNKIDEAITNAH